MKIDNLHSERNNDLARVAATVIWEDNDIPPREIYFETEGRFASSLSCNPHAFLVACLLPALRHNEARIFIDEPICPELRQGLNNAMDLIIHWFYPQKKQLRIESRILADPIRLKPPRAASFLSGGVDSLALLRKNHLDYPVEHPRFIKDCIFVHGFDIGGYDNLDDQIDYFTKVYSSLIYVSRDASVELIPLHTNIKHLDDDVDFWEYEFFGAALSAVAHIFSNQLSTVSLASSYDVYHLRPHGSHPLLDPNYSSFDMQIRHEGIFLSRLEKVQLLGDWEVALNNIRVCTSNVPGLLNCGQCEKCVRTMLQLLVLGKLEISQSFTYNDVTQEMLRPIFFRNEAVDSYYLELVEPLKEINRLDLAAVILQKSSQFHKHLDWAEERDWKGAIKRIDRRYFRGNLARFRDRFKSPDVLAWQAQEKQHLSKMD